MFEFRAKPKLVPKTKPVRQPEDTPTTFKPLLLEKAYIIDQEKRIKSEFLAKSTNQAS